METVVAAWSNIEFLGWGGSHAHDGSCHPAPGSPVQSMEPILTMLGGVPGPSGLWFQLPSLSLFLWFPEPTSSASWMCL